MFETIKALISGKDLIKDAYDDTFEMVRRVDKLYREATALLLDGTQPSIDIHREDKLVNEAEARIRKHIFEHLAITRTELSASLMLTGIVGYIERVGDYAKNIEELAVMYGRPLRECAIAAPLVEATATVDDAIDLTGKALAEEDEDAAREIIALHKKVRRICDDSLGNAFKSEGPSSRDALVCAMYGRYLKRIMAGLKNAATTVLVPFDHIGYTKGLKKKEDKKDEGK